MQRQLDRTQRRGGVLASQVAELVRRERVARARRAATSRRRGEVQRSLGVERGRLRALRARLAALRARARRLRAELERQRRTLARRLDATYRSDRPDAVTVILEADGFANLLEDAAYLKRVLRQDGRVMLRTRRLRDETVRAERGARLLVLEIAVAVRGLERREAELAKLEVTRERQRRRLEAAAAQRSVALKAIRRRSRRLEDDLGSLRREQAAIAAAQRRAAAQAASASAARKSLAPAAPAPAPDPPASSGGGGMLVPVDGPVTSPFGPRDGRLHAGLDIGAPCGRPIRAATSGTVAMAGVNGGYGNYVLVQQTTALATGYAHL